MNLIIIGLPGCGKGTQSELISKEYSLTHISSGDLLREEQNKGTARGQKIARFMQEGVLFPDDIVNSILLDHVPEKNFILDGYPRKLSQVEVIKNIDKVIYLTLSEDEAIRRILDRNQGRLDDNEDAIRIRLHAFREKTQPVIDYYDKHKKLIEVDASGSPEEVFLNIKKILNKIKWFKLISFLYFNILLNFEKLST